jgi:hypothetical protein
MYPGSASSVIGKIDSGLYSAWRHHESIQTLLSCSETERLCDSSEMRDRQKLLLIRASSWYSIRFLSLRVNHDTFSQAMTKPLLVFTLIERDFSKIVTVEELQRKLRDLTTANQYREPSI